jgi:hypothetical protein
MVLSPVQHSVLQQMVLSPVPSGGQVTFIKKRSYFTSVTDRRN